MHMMKLMQEATIIPDIFRYDEKHILDYKQSFNNFLNYNYGLKAKVFLICVNMTIFILYII